MTDYIEEIKSNLVRLESYAHSCFIARCGFANCQGGTGDKFVKAFMKDLTDGQFLKNQQEIYTINDCIDELLPDCQNAFFANETKLYGLVRDWVHDNAFQCVCCGKWFLAEDCAVDGSSECVKCHDL